MKTDLRIYCTLLLELLLSQVALCTPTISGLKVTPIEPLGLAIDYNVSGAEEKHKAWPLEVSMRVGKKIYTANVVSGATLCENGAHRVYWNVAKDGITLGKTNMDVVVTYKYTPTDGALYCVIDLSGGPDATSYPIKYFDEKPSGGFNTTEYKTKKLVLKRVDAGSFTMGYSSESDNQPHTVKLTKSFYMGLYEVTQKQWELVMGTNPSYFSGEANPVECVSYDMIRGAVEGAKWPATNSVDATSFLGKLRDRTKLDFDLPTEAQWEYTCRAGTTTEWSYGDNADGDYMWYWDNSSLGTKEVGSKLPNKWGFYDMHGNALEWCLDWRGALAYGADPKGSSSGSYRVLRGGCWAHGAFHSTSSYQDCILSSFSGSSYGSLGFRLSRTLP
jgi:formylglycine-generating enzyme required for sulfatase activity